MLKETLVREKDMETEDVQVERMALAALTDGVIVCDSHGRIILINPAAERLLALTGVATGQSARELFRGLGIHDAGPLLVALDHLYQDPGSAVESPAEVVFAVQARMIQARLSPMLGASGEFVGGMLALRDVTREAELDRAKSEFVSNVSHELRRPLTAIKGYSDLLLFSPIGSLNEQQEHFLRIMQNSADRLVSLTNDLLDISHIETGRLELDRQPVPVEQLAREVVQKLQPLCVERGVHLSMKAEVNVGMAIGDKNRLAQVITYLINNALYYTPENGHILLALSHSDKAVRVDVSDSGPGIPPEEQGKLFQRFYRVNNPALADAPGTGLGLPIAKLLVEMHGGSLLVESRMGHGSTFTFVLPRQGYMAAAAVAEKPEVNAPRTVLVVEDEYDISELIALQLRSEGFEVLTTARGEEALALVNSRPIDLITLDMMLPDITGMEVLRRLKSQPRTADIPVIVVSVIQPKSTGPAWGAVEHISKPFALDKLMDTVRRILAAAARGRLTPLTVVE